MPQQATAMTRRAFERVLVAGALAAGAMPVRGEEAKSTRRIAFVDYDLNNYHADVYLKLLRGPLAGRGYELVAATALEQDKSRAWAKRNNVRYVESIAGLRALADCFVVLAPDNPETHLELCQAVFPFGKPTYVDKTFAPDFATAQRIFALADRHGTPIQSTSALRYTTVQSAIAKDAASVVRHMIAWGGGASFRDKLIHPLELVISCMGHEATHLMRIGGPPETQLVLRFTNGRTAIVNMFNEAQTAYAATVTTQKATQHIAVNVGEIFANTMAATLDFFDAGTPQIDKRQTLAIMRIIDAANNDSAIDRFVSLDEELS